jgi:hypothetical protein
MLSAFRTSLPAGWSVNGVWEALQALQSDLYLEKEVGLVDPDALGHVCA